MSVRLWPVLPKDHERNGLVQIEQQLIDDPDGTHVIVAILNQRRVTTDADSGETTPAARVVHVEALTGPDAESGRALLAAACKARTGAEQIPYPDGDAGDDPVD